MKLKLSLGLPLYEGESMDRLKEFFNEKFKKPQYPEFLQTPEDTPDLEIMNAKIFGHMTELNDKKKGTGGIKFEATRLRE